MKKDTLILEIKLYNKLIGTLLRKGYKEKSISFFSHVFYNLSHKIKVSFSFLVWGLFKRLKVRVEARKVKIKGRNFFVPFKISFNRQLCLIAKWIVKALYENNKKVLITDKLIEELLYAFKNNSNSKILRYRESNYKLALLNRSNLHYRW